MNLSKEKIEEALKRLSIRSDINPKDKDVSVLKLLAKSYLEGSLPQQEVGVDELTKFIRDFCGNTIIITTVLDKQDQVVNLARAIHQRIYGGKE